MTRPIIPGSAQQDLEGRSVRDIVEYSPEQVDEAWCRKILRKILQSLELQYAMQMPHRVITPDTVVFHANGEPLLISDDIDAAPAQDERLADDLTALARVLHYAITQELIPTGPLHGRAPGYSASLIATVDACMDTDPAQRPHDVAAVRTLLGIVAPPVGAISLSDKPTPAQSRPAVQLGKPASTADVRPERPPPSPGGAPEDAAATVTSSMPAAGVNAARSADNSANDEQITRPAHTATAARAAPAPAQSAVPIIAAAVAASTAQILHKPSAPAPAPDVPLATGPFAGIGAMPPPAVAPHPMGMGRGQRWAIGAGAAAIVIAIALALFAELRDSGSYDHVVLTLPQPGAGAPPGLPTPDGGATPPALAGNAGAGAPGTSINTAASNAANNLPHGTAAGAAADAASGVTTGAAPDLIANPPGNLTSSPASGASSGGTTSGGGREQPDDMTRVASNAANANASDSTATMTTASARAGTPARTNEEAGAAPASLAAGNASYQLQIKPWGIVYVDGVDRGVSPPVKRLTLTPGRHTVRITNPNFRDSVLEFDSAQATSNGKIIVDFNHEAQ